MSFDKATIVAQLATFCPEPGAVIWQDEALGVWECDGFTLARARPLAVVLPRTTQQVSDILAWTHQAKIPVVARGAGTGLSGGALPVEDGIVVSLARFTRVLEVDLNNRCAVVQAGVTNLNISKAVDNLGFYYAPDPSSQLACTIGGNVAENAGGIHCLKYGVTTNNVLAVELVLPDGEIVRLGNRSGDGDGYDLLGVVTGSEGLLGIVTEITVRLLRQPQAVRTLMAGFAQTEQAGKVVSAIIAAGIIPAALEMMDSASILAVEDFCHPGYPVEAQALLIAELDGPEAEVEAETQHLLRLLQEAGATSITLAQSPQERQLIWLGRRSAFSAVGRISRDYLCVDGTIPRHQLAAVLARIGELAAEYGLRVANVFHAGDGNLHPLVLYDSGQPDHKTKAEELGLAILKLCVDVGGVLSGEHGIGVEKRPLMTHMFTADDLTHQHALKLAFDPDNLLNPGKVFPTLTRCADLGWLRTGDGNAFAHLPRF